MKVKEVNIAAAVTTLALIILAKEAGASKVVIGESSGKTALCKGTDQAFRVARLHIVARRQDVELMDFDKTPYQEVEIKNPQHFTSMKIAKPILDYDVLINVPVLKTHCNTGISVSMKNMYGTIPDKDKWKIHIGECRIEEALVDIISVRRADLVVVDGTIGLQGLGGGVSYMSCEPITAGVIIAGFDMVAVDAVSSRVMDIDPSTIQHLKWAEEKGLGIMDLSRIQLYGSPISSAVTRFETPIEHINLTHDRIQLIDGGSCTGCYGKVVTGIMRVRDKDLIPEGMRIFMGPKAEPTSREGGINIIVGDCLKEYKDMGKYLGGCPLSLKDFEEMISPYIRDFKSHIEIFREAGLLD